MTKSNGSKKKRYKTLAGRLVDPKFDPKIGEYYISQDKTSAVKVLAISKSPNDNQVLRRVHYVEIYRRSEKLSIPLSKKMGIGSFKNRYPWISTVYLSNKYDEGF